ncbi:hypothetical protein IAD21_03579 [Abditibacteriota bacterium]|nr:hypothetical protein IAD21_03579 [Abditibacteriota bacterium]
MRKIIIALALAVATAAAVTAPSAQAQTYPSVSGLTAFSPECNYMSKPGYLRYRYYQDSKEFISYETAARIVQEQGG